MRLVDVEATMLIVGFIGILFAVPVWVLASEKVGLVIFFESMLVFMAGAVLTGLDDDFRTKDHEDVVALDRRISNVEGIVRANERRVNLDTGLPEGIRFDSHGNLK